jgi:hypothetical protein
MRSIAETHSDSEILPAREQTTEQLEADLTEVNGAQGWDGGGPRSMNAGGESKV